MFQWLCEADRCWETAASPGSAAVSPSRHQQPRNRAGNEFLYQGGRIKGLMKRTNRFSFWSPGKNHHFLIPHRPSDLIQRDEKIPPNQHWYFICTQTSNSCKCISLHLTIDSFGKIHLTISFSSLNKASSADNRNTGGYSVWKMTSSEKYTYS